MMWGRSSCSLVKSRAAVAVVGCCSLDAAAEAADIAKATFSSAWCFPTFKT